MRNHVALGVLAPALLLAGGVGWILFSRSRGADVPLSHLEVVPATELRLAPAAVWDEPRLIELGRRDPLEAIRLSRTLDNRAARERILMAALESLRRSDPALAAEVVEGLPAGDFQQIAAGQVATAFAAVDPGAAFSWARGLGDDATRLRAIREVAAVWAESDPAAAAASVAALGSEREKQLGALAIATAWTRRDPAAALAWAAALQPPEARALVSGSALQTWAETDAPAAMDWLADQPAEFHAAIDPGTGLGIMRKWAAQDPGAVREFVQRMTPGAAQARAVDIVAVQLAKSDPVAAMNWSLTLPEETIRNGAFSAAYRRWQETDPQLAAAWLNEAELTAEEKRRLVRYP